MKPIRKQIARLWLFILLPLILSLTIFAYYQLYYKPVIVESGIVKPEMIFTAHTAQLRSVRFTQAGDIASGSVDSTVRIWKRSGEIISTLKHPAGVTGMDISADSSIVTGSYDGIVRLWKNGALLKEFKSGNNKTVWSVAFSPDGKTIASGGDEPIVNIWDVATGRLIHTLRGHSLTVWSVKFSPDGSKIVSASFDAMLNIWNVADGKLLHTIDGHSEAIVDIAFSNNGKMLASTSDDKTIKLWSMPAGKLIRTLEVAEHVQAAVFSPDDKYLLTAGRDKPSLGELMQEIFGEKMVNKGVGMRLWNAETGELLQTFTEHNNDVNDVAWSTDGWIASASEDKTVRLWKFVK